MPRGARVDYEGAWHHVVNRGARRVPVFDSDTHAGTFLRIVGETALRFDLEVHSYAVMPNHYHLLVRSVRGNLSRAMRHLGACFTQEINRLYGWDGPVFRGRFRNQLVENERYLLTVVAYIHLNPHRAGIARRLDQHCWTSHRAYLGLDLPPEWLSRDFILSLVGGEKAFAEFVVQLKCGNERWPAELNIDSGWLNIATSEAPWSLHRANVTERVLPETVPSPAQVLSRIAAIANTSLQDLRRARYGRGANAARRFAVWALAQSTQLTQAEIGSHLHMSPSHVAVTLRRFGSAATEPLREWTERWVSQEWTGRSG